MALSVASFGRSFLVLYSARRPSWRLAFRALAAARLRWPDGRLSVGRAFGGGVSVRWMVPGFEVSGEGCCGVMVVWKWG